MSPSSKKKQLFNYGRYSGIAFQMIAVMLAGVWAGIQTDKWIHTKPIFTIILSLISVVLAIYLVTKDLIRRE